MNLLRKTTRIHLNNLGSREMRDNNTTKGGLGEVQAHKMTGAFNPSQGN